MDRSTDTGADGGRWLLYRIDDNGNEVERRRVATRDEAEAAMCAFEGHGHKQAYLVREEKKEA